MTAVEEEGRATYAALEEIRPHNTGPLRTITAVDSYAGTTQCAEADIYPVLEGVGTVHARLGYTFSGALEKGEPSGQGTLRWSDGRTVVGVFAHGTVDGVGTLHWPNGDLYTGMLRHSVRNGSGSFVSDGGASRYEGDWQDGMRHGDGVQQYANESVYTGQWVHNARHGRGTLRYCTGDVYEGEWDGDVPSGRGAMGWVDASKAFFKELYVGEWRDGQPEGAGQSTYVAVPKQSATTPVDASTPLPVPSMFITPAEARLNVYMGEYSKGQRDGAGTFYYADGSCYQGRWKAGEKSGLGFFTSAVGEMVEEQDNFHSALVANTDAEQISALAIVPTVSPCGLGNLLESEDDLRLVLHNLLQRYNTTLKTLFQHCCRLREGVALPSTPWDWWQQRLPGRVTLVQCLALLHTAHIIGADFTIGDTLRTAADVVDIETTDLEMSMLSSTTHGPTSLSSSIEDINQADGTLNYRQFCEWLIRVAVQVEKGPATITVSAKLSALLEGSLRVATTSTGSPSSSSCVAAVFLPHSLRHSAEVQAHLPALRKCYKELQTVRDGERDCCSRVSLRSSLTAMRRTLAQHHLTPAGVAEALAWLKDEPTAAAPNDETAPSQSLAEELRVSAMTKNKLVQQPNENAEAAQSFVEFVETIMTAAHLADCSDGAKFTALLHEIQRGLYEK
ncbi:hypothetical protein ABB37_07284 [Leptomonas pyrrhocoris]|uniref:Uncharacterized protein n=1 Tax=Leptomonas pyrrhocoris TaxID=157538 RepID=A0A0M9FVK8_LEPPY|nr:hypothetical protein ABB37_07284 [Leptomonas pyrrhocoris]XP_015655332.1 hypothetical protein ABB37_07284 [Leptomonas pyrrhocoris]KPA76892.1 hypothetical protein ABB37_07284 [Leptomonas pyrrhocoris]KPA76893.1 hypothetical protein ABB37_07284 [Leptomonas pyrrhocoris]|eukprot:XP_015655331.1 hypothetical protein ABB37_07284 [Leptomonas pyrrhocoris]